MSKLEGSPTEEIVAQVNNLGLKDAAAFFNTSPATLSRWLKAQHFKIKRIYVREEPPPTFSPQAIMEQVLRDQLKKAGLPDNLPIVWEDVP